MALTQKITLDTSQFKQGMDECKSSVSSANSEIQKQTKGVTDLAAATHAASAKTTNYRRQFMELQRQLQSMLINYRALSDEEKNSDFGKKLSRQIDELTVKAADWKDSLGDMQAAITAASSDTLKWDAMNEGLDIAKTSLESFVSLTGLADTESEKFKQTIATLTKIETTFNAVIKITNALQKNSSLMLQITALQARARKAAEANVTGELVKQTVAQKALNTVAKANPYVLLATVLVTVGAAIATFTGLLKDNTDELEDNTDAAEKAKQAQEKFKNSLSSAFGSQMANYKKLQTEWKNLKTEFEKTEFLTKYKNELEKLPVVINDITDADNAFIYNTNAVISALQKRAMATAAMTQAEELYGEYIVQNEELIKRQQESKNKAKAYNAYKKENELLAIENNKKGAGKNVSAERQQTERELKRAAEEAQASVVELKTSIYKLKNSADSLIENAISLTNFGGKGGNNSNSNSGNSNRSAETKKPHDYSKEGRMEGINTTIMPTSQIKELNKQLAELKEKQKEVSDNPFLNKTYQDQIDSITSKIKNLTDIKVELPFTINTNEVQADLDKINAQLDLLYAKKWYKNEAISESYNLLKQTSQAVTEIGTSWKNVKDVFKSDDADFLDKFSALSNAIFGTVDAIVGMVQTIQTLCTILQTFSSIKQTTAAANAAATQVETNATMGQVAANEAEAISGAAASGNSIPFPGNLAAIAASIAAVVAVIAMIAGLSKHANGGIVNSGSMVGDMNMIRVNGGEMVLNTAQQTKLFGILNGTNSYQATQTNGGEVKFKIKGNDLEGVLKTTNTKNSKL